MEDKGTLTPQTFTNNGGEPQAVPTGTAPGNPTKPHPNPKAGPGPTWTYPKGK